MDRREIWATLLEFYPARYWLVYIPLGTIGMLWIEGMFIYAYVAMFGKASFWALAIATVAITAACIMHKENFDPFTKYDHLET